MGQQRLKMRIAVAAAAAIAFGILPGRASAQDTTVVFPVLIEGTPVGSATVAANLPTEFVVLHQNADPNLASKQIESAQQGNVILTTADPKLIAAVEDWVKANNSGDKNTVQRKTVEIDRIEPAKPPLRFRLTSAWPSKVEKTAGTTVITVIYQSLQPILQ